MFDIEKCNMCMIENTKACSIRYFLDRLQYKKSIKKYIIDVIDFNNRVETMDKVIYLKKAIEERFPKYMKLFNTIELLY